MVQVSRGSPSGAVARRASRSTLYELLQVSPQAEPAVIQAAYRALARSSHPDLQPGGTAHERMQDLNGAYEVLSNPRQRAIYDLSLNQQALDQGENDVDLTRVRRRTSCWRCTEPLAGAYASYCSACHWIVCERCRTCGCQHPDWQPARTATRGRSLPNALGWITAALLAAAWLMTSLVPSLLGPH